MFNIAITALTVLANGAFGLVLFKNNRRSATNLFLVLLLWVIMAWAIFTHLALEMGSPDQRLFFVRLVMFSTVPFGPLIYLLARVFPGSQLTIRKSILMAILVVNLIIAGLALTPLMFSKLINSPDGSFIIIPSYGIALYGFNFIGFMSWGFFLLVRKYRTNVGIQKTQIGLFLYGLIISCVLLTITNFLAVIILASIDLVRFGPPLTLILISFMTYAILKHGLLDIRVLLARSIGYSVTAFLLFSVYSLVLMFFGAQLLGRETSLTEFIISFFLIIIIAFSFAPLQKIVASLTKRIFYKDDYDSEKLLYDLAVVMATTLLLENLSRKLLKLLLIRMQVTRGMMILTEQNLIYWVAAEGYATVPEFNEEDIKQLTQAENLVVFEETQDKTVKQFMDRHNLKLSSKFIKESKTIGFLFLGDKLSGDSYTSKDRTLVTIFSPEAAVAIQNAKAYEEIRRFNITLEEEVKNATNKLVRANGKLQELDKLKDEFVSIASHELRTPMVSIKNYVWMALAGKGGKVTQKQKFYLQRAFISADRMTKLINDMLNISRIESGRVMLSPVKVNLLALVEQILAEVKPRAKQLEVKLILEKEAKNLHSEQEVELPEVVADQDKLAEVLTNFLGNSLKFTPAKGSITVSFAVDQKTQQVIVQVADTGVGLAADQIPKLFKKFGIIKESYRSQTEAAQGSGLGLFVSKSIIELHGGKIWVESKGKDKGSTFSFSVPIYSEETMTSLKKKFNSPADKGMIRTKIE
ncbi:MAG: hypothetical protein COY81_05450 [Candidatus Pacebacteria bacterium CG_4_10_14_0_8_um_filter_43_12]|nr:MAG: hypothetical protein COY81_05450 [Candidatus Pacebacteria bacterium CG_4_10_14_0_8_um_filter_43_12]